MDTGPLAIKSILVANRGEIAARIMRTARQAKLFPTILSHHLSALELKDGSWASELWEYTLRQISSLCMFALLTRRDQIIKISLDKGVSALIPGYGFLSENADFARQVVKAGLIFVGPSPDSIDQFGIKHVARTLAREAGVPIVPGTQDLVGNVADAIQSASKLGYPVMLKATAGGGGMGLQACYTEEEVKQSFAKIESRGSALFKNSGVFLERYFPSSRHIEVQVFGNGLGDVITFFERECSIQRRHQKVIEECPSPFVAKRHEMRQALGDAAVRLAASVVYKSAGTVEFLVDDTTAEFFFLEMNTRLQVEHGITEMCYSVDLVEMMLRQADAEFVGTGGITKLKSMQPTQPKGAAIEARVYAENPVRNYTPAPGILQELQWKEEEGVRVDTWVRKGMKITPFYDPLLAKVMVHTPTREETIERTIAVLSDSVLVGPPTNIDLMVQVLGSTPFKKGETTTNFLQTKLDYRPCAIDVIAGGALTTIQDLPAFRGVGMGIPESGPMDSLAFQVANILVGNPRNMEALEITGFGPELLFLASAIVSVCGADISPSVDGQPVGMWQQVRIEAGQTLVMSKITGPGSRAYMAVRGGFPSLTPVMGSKATSVALLFGGYQGRRLAAGDLLTISPLDSSVITDAEKSLPVNIIPRYHNHWEIYAMPGPHEEGYLTDNALKMIYSTQWSVSHNASRTGIKLIGPGPEFARQSGGEGGAHPSNVLEYGYSLGTVNWGGDQATIFGIEGPDLGGFISSPTVIRAEFWRLGQMKPGDTVTFRRISTNDAVALRTRTTSFLDAIEQFVSGNNYAGNLQPLDLTAPTNEFGKALLAEIQRSQKQPRVEYRQGGDDYILVVYGEGSQDMNLRARADLLEAAIRRWQDANIISTAACHLSLLVQYDSTKLDQGHLLKRLLDAEKELGEVQHTRIPSRLYRLPLTVNDSVIQNNIEKYMQTTRPYATYLPDNLSFCARFNGISREEAMQNILSSRQIVSFLGFYSAIPVLVWYDPRKCLRVPKWNPPRLATPEGTFALGGTSGSLYNTESPGGYQMIGRTIPCWDLYCLNRAYKDGKPVAFRPFDQLSFHLVSESEYNRQLDDFHAGQYEYDVEETTFDLGQYNDFLDSVRGELAGIRQRQIAAGELVMKEENELFQRWKAEADKASANDMGGIEQLLTDANIITVPSPMTANVWKVQVNEGDLIQEDTIIAILEAMKMEINVPAPESVVGCVVRKIVAPPGTVTSPGDPIVLCAKA
ncbi:Urea amidolyase [Exophiala dermatitidis]